MALYCPTLQFYLCMYKSFVCRYVALPGECHYNTVLYNTAYVHAVLLHCTKNITVMPNFFSFAASIAELAHGENRVLSHSLTHTQLI